MDYRQRKPSFDVTITRPRYTDTSNVEDAVASFDSSAANSALIAYTYEMAIESFESPFSLTFTPAAMNTAGDTIIDVIRPLDLVKITEHGEVKYYGLVESIRYSARMDEGGPSRSISVSGYGISGVLDRFAMLLDQVILADSDTEISAMQTAFAALMENLSAEYGENTSFTLILNKIRQSYKEAMEKIGKFTPSTGIMKIADKYLQFGSDVFGNEMNPTTKYPMALSLFTYGQITLGQAFRGLVLKPFYEMFCRWEPQSKTWAIITRPTPFSPSRWLALPKTEIDPVYVDAFDAGFSSAEVKTFFFAYLSGGALTYEQARSMYQNTAIKRDSAKWAVYGYRPLEAAFRFVNQVSLSDKKNKITITKTNDGPNGKAESISDEKLMDEYATMLRKWFGRADEMLSGSITMMTIQNGPKIGERVSFNGAEFYVEAISCSWQYGGRMNTTLRLTRGGNYNVNFVSGTGPDGMDEESKDNWWFKRADSLGSRLELKKVVPQ